MKKMIAVISLLLISAPAMAQKMSMGFLAGATTASQEDVNTLIERADIREDITTRSLDRRPTFEFAGYWQYEFEDTNLAIHIRPSYLFVDEDGSQINTANRYEYYVSGYTLFPMLKMYFYEKDRTRVFAQGGFGWGFVNLKVDEGPGTFEASAMQIGSQIGVGGEFCVFGENHCLTVEGSYRYLEFQRMEIDSFAGTFDNGPFRGISNPTLEVGGEIEIDDRDLRTTFSGFIGLVGYTYYFE